MSTFKTNECSCIFPAAAAVSNDIKLAFFLKYYAFCPICDIFLYCLYNLFAHMENYVHLFGLPNNLVVGSAHVVNSKLNCPLLICKQSCVSWCIDAGAPGLLRNLFRLKLHDHAVSPLQYDSLQHDWWFVAQRDAEHLKPHLQMENTDLGSGQTQCLRPEREKGQLQDYTSVCTQYLRALRGLDFLRPAEIPTALYSTPVTNMGVNVTPCMVYKQGLH